jgi:hypothetical protein
MVEGMVTVDMEDMVMVAMVEGMVTVDMEDMVMAAMVEDMVTVDMATADMGDMDTVDMAAITRLRRRVAASCGCHAGSICLHAFKGLR